MSLLLDLYKSLYICVLLAFMYQEQRPD